MSVAVVEKAITSEERAYIALESKRPENSQGEESVPNHPGEKTTPEKRDEMSIYYQRNRGMFEGP